MVNSPDYVDLTPIQIYARLLDAGIYPGSIWSSPWWWCNAVSFV